MWLCVRACVCAVCVCVRGPWWCVHASACVHTGMRACASCECTGPLLCLRIGVGLVIGDLAHGTMGKSSKRTDLPSCLLLALKLGSHHGFFEELVI